jgi:hypothetical protein
MDKLIDRYWELKREIINTPPIYFLKLKRLFREYKEIKEKIGRKKKTGRPANLPYFKLLNSKQCLKNSYLFPSPLW